MTGRKPNTLNRFRQRWLRYSSNARRVFKVLITAAVSGLVVAMLLYGFNPDSTMFQGPGAELVINLIAGIITSTVIGFYLNQGVTSDLEAKFAVIKSSENAGLASVYPDRPAALEELRRLASVAWEYDVDILTIAGGDFFKEGKQTYTVLFDEPLDRRIPHRFRILCLHPLSKAAVERSHRELSDADLERIDAKIEELQAELDALEKIRDTVEKAIDKVDGTSAELEAAVQELRSAQPRFVTAAKAIYDVAPYAQRGHCRDVLRSLTCLEETLDNYKARGFSTGEERDEFGRFKSGTSIPRIQVGLYYSTPSMLLIRFDNRIFVEQYHIGRDALWANAPKPPKPANTGPGTLQPGASEASCLARKVPVACYYHDSTSGGVFANHFEHLWSRADMVLNNETRPDTTALLNQLKDPMRYVQTLADLHIYGARLNCFLKKPHPRNPAIKPRKTGSAPSPRQPSAGDGAPA